MSVQGDIKTQTPDFIEDGDSHRIEPGQHIIQGPMLVEGEIIIQGHLIII